MLGQPHQPTVPACLPARHRAAGTPLPRQVHPLAAFPSLGPARTYLLLLSHHYLKEKQGSQDVLGEGSVEPAGLQLPAGLPVTHQQAGSLTHSPHESPTEPSQKLPHGSCRPPGKRACRVLSTAAPHDCTKPCRRTLERDTGVSPAGSNGGDSCLQRDGEENRGRRQLDGCCWQGTPRGDGSVAPMCWVRAVLGKYLKATLSRRVNSRIIVCTRLRYRAQSGTICEPYPASWPLRGSHRLRPAAPRGRSGPPELGVTGERSTSVGAGGAAASEVRHDAAALRHTQQPQG